MFYINGNGGFWYWSFNFGFIIESKGITNVSNKYESMQFLQLLNSVDSVYIKSTGKIKPGYTPRDIDRIVPIKFKDKKFKILYLKEQRSNYDTFEYGSGPLYIELNRAYNNLTKPLITEWYIAPYEEQKNLKRYKDFLHKSVHLYGWDFVEGVLEKSRYLYDQAYYRALVACNPQDRSTCCIPSAKEVFTILKKIVNRLERDGCKINGKEFIRT